MANTIAKAVRYLSEPAALMKTLQMGSYTQDLVDTEARFEGTRTVKYQRLSFGEDPTLGTFDIETGYTRTPIVGEWVEQTLTQDKGNSLYFDVFEDEEATANGIFRVTNRYIYEIQAPAVDIYRFNSIKDKTGVYTKQLDLDSTNILDEILTAFAHLEENRIDTSSLILYITPTANQVLKSVSANQGYYHFGNWNGLLDTEVEMFDTARLHKVPASILGEDTNFILLNKNAAPAFVKYTESEFFYKIPGFGKRRHQADVGIYHDAFVYDELVDAIYVSKKGA